MPTRSQREPVTRRPIPLLFLLLGATACSQPRVSVDARLAGESAAAGSPVRDLPIRLLPYDRAAILDSLRSDAKQPEPAPPPDLVAQQQAQDSAESLWRGARSEAAALSDSVQALRARLATLETGSAAYDATQREIGRVERRQGEVKLSADSAFARFTRLRRVTGPRVDSLRTARRAWAAATFSPLDSIALAKAKSRGHSEAVDTTGAEGEVVFRVPAGRWWVFARYAVSPDEELVWNLPVEVTDSGAHVHLTGRNAKRQPIL